MQFPFEECEGETVLVYQSLSLRLCFILSLNIKNDSLQTRMQVKYTDCNDYNDECSELLIVNGNKCTKGINKS